MSVVKENFPQTSKKTPQNAFIRELAKSVSQAAAAAGGRAAGGARGNAGAILSAKLAQKTRLMEAGNALRVCPAETWLTVYRRLHMTHLKKLRAR